MFYNIRFTLGIIPTIHVSRKDRMVGLKLHSLSSPKKKAALVEKKCQIQGMNSAGWDGV